MVRVIRLNEPDFAFYVLASYGLNKKFAQKCMLQPMFVEFLAYLVI